MKNNIAKFSKSLLTIFIGVLLGLLILELSLRGVGYYLKHWNKFTYIQTKQPDELRILTLGESMTNSGIRKYPDQLQEILSNNPRVNKKIRVINGGVPGSSSRDIVKNIESYIDQYNPDIVVTMTGVNSDNIVDYEKWANIKKDEGLNKLKTIKLIKYFYQNIAKRLSRIFIKLNFLNVYASETNVENILNNLREKYSKYLTISSSPREIEINNKLNTTTINKDKIYMEYSDYYASIYDLERQIIYAVKALSINPKIARAYWRLSTDGTKILTFDEREKLLLKGIEVDPSDIESYIHLGRLYSNNGSVLSINKNSELKVKELKVYLKGIENNPNSAELWFWLGKYYYWNDNLIDSEIAFKKALGLNNIDSSNRTSDIYQLLAKIYQKQNRTEEANKVLGLATSTNDVLENNYPIIANILNSRGVKLIAMQYPLRDVNILKNILKDYDVLFVDNKKSFEVAIKEQGLENIFIDLFAGDFGHCTPEGNRIIANNVATVILNNFNLEK